MGGIFSILHIIQTILTVTFIIVGILSAIFILPKAKIIMDAINAYTNVAQNINTMTPQPCISRENVDMITIKINDAKTALETLKTYPIISSIIPGSLETSLDDILINLKKIMKCPYPSQTPAITKRA
jgi:hypothetical protein